MYIRYIVSTNGNQAADDLAKLFNGTYTSASDFQYAGRGSFISGTAPSAGVYTVTDASGNEWTTEASSNFILTKKHVQYNASTFPATTQLRMFAVTSGNATLGMATNNGSNLNMGSSPGGNISFSNKQPGTVFHIIWNDTTLAINAIQTPQSDTRLTQYFTSCMSDFQKTDYDVTRLTANSLYYPGCLLASTSTGPDQNFYNEASWPKNSFSVYRPQAMTPSGAYFNTAISVGFSSNYSMWTNVNNLGNHPTVHPRPHIRIPTIFINNENTTPLIPIIYDASGIAGYTYNAAIASDTRFFGVMLNTYRAADNFRLPGQSIIHTDGNEYIIMRGHRPPDSIANTGTGAYQATCYAFPVNNVGV